MAREHRYGTPNRLDAVGYLIIGVGVAITLISVIL